MYIISTANTFENVITAVEIKWFNVSMLSSARLRNINPTQHSGRNAASNSMVDTRIGRDN